MAPRKFRPCFFRCFCLLQTLEYGYTVSAQNQNFQVHKNTEVFFIFLAHSYNIYCIYPNTTYVQRCITYSEAQLKCNIKTLNVYHILQAYLNSCNVEYHSCAVKQPAHLGSSCADVC